MPLNDNEIKLGQTKIGPNTTIQINLKTLFVVVGILMSGLTTMYLNISSSMKSISEKNAAQISDLTKEVRALKDQDLKELNRIVGNIDGKVEGIYRSLPGNSYSFPTGGPTIQNQTPQRPR